MPIESVRLEMESYSMIDPNSLDFVTPIPDYFHLKCPICLSLLLPDAPMLVTCCGSHFCQSCVDKLPVCRDESDEEDEDEEEGGDRIVCPFCKDKKFKSVPDKNHQRALRNLNILCINNKFGCMWRGELGNLAKHLSKEGDCKYVTCPNNCGEQVLRTKLLLHESLKCPKLPVASMESQQMKILAAMAAQLENISGRVELLHSRVQTLEEAYHSKEQTISPSLQSYDHSTDYNMFDSDDASTSTPSPDQPVSVTM